MNEDLLHNIPEEMTTTEPSQAEAAQEEAVRRAKMQIVHMPDAVAMDADVRVAASLATEVATPLPEASGSADEDPVEAAFLERVSTSGARNSWSMSSLPA